MFEKFQRYFARIVKEMGGPTESKPPAFFVVAALLVVAEQLDRIAETQEEAHK